MNSLWLPQGSLLICETENNTYSLRLVAQHDPAGKLHIWETSHLLFSSATSGGVFLVSKASRRLSKVLSGHAAHIIGFSINYNKQRLLCLSPSPLPPPRPYPLAPNPSSSLNLTSSSNSLENPRLNFWNIFLLLGGCKGRRGKTHKCPLLSYLFSIGLGRVHFF